MPELSIRFTSDEKKEDSPISVSLIRMSTGNMTPPVSYEIPLDEKVLSDIHWYLELYPIWPMEPDFLSAERIESQLKKWGQELLESFIGDGKAREIWVEFRNSNRKGKLLTIDSTDPRILRLPWEILADEGGHLFSRGISVRRRLAKTGSVTVRSFALPVRILVVVSRPDDAGFIDSRVISKSLVEAVEHLGSNVAVEFLYPPTIEALTDRLRDRKAPPVHVVHFDGHGVYNTQLGLGFLLFENKDHKEDLVDADRLGTLLNQSEVPLMVLNACQSAKQENANPYASVAAGLIQAGVGSVIAMNYSVLVVAAKKFTEAFYSAVSDGLSVGMAMDEGRYKLLNDVERHFITRTKNGKTEDQTIRLRDWFLPALYQQQQDPVVFDPEAAPDHLPETRPVPDALVNPTVPGGLPAEPNHQFHGRSREMLLLERTFHDRPVVVLHGFGGMGKTALSAEAGRWFRRTGRFPGGAAFVSFEQGGSLNQLCSWVGQAVGQDPDFMIRDGDPVERVGQLLRERPALIILDNFESVIGRNPLMPPDELKAVLDAVWGWASPPASSSASFPSFRRKPESSNGPCILITTRDTNFSDTRFTPSRDCAHIQLEGLARNEALELAAAILADHGIDRAKIGRESLITLMDRLGGHPLSLYLVLPLLKDHTPETLADEFEQLLPGFKTGAAKERNESLTVSLEFSIQRLGEETQAALPSLAVFQGGGFENQVIAVTGLTEDRWQNVRAELEAAALVTAESIPGVNSPFLQFHPTLLPWLAGRLPEVRRKERENQYWRRYYAVANYLYKADTQNPHQARAIAVREMSNLKRALDLCIQAGEVETAVNFADNIERFLNVFGRWRERDAMMKQLEGLTPQGEKLSRVKYLMLDKKGDMLLQQGLANEAEKVFRHLQKRIQLGADYDSTYDFGMIFLSIGRCLVAQGRPAQAIENHRQAIEVFGRLSEGNENAKKMLSTSYTDLADNLMDAGQCEEAKEFYEKSLEIDKQTGEIRNMGATLSQLGTLAMREGSLKKAAELHTEALDTFRRLGEPQSEAVIWHQLGMVHQEAKNWDEADRCYREAVKIYERMQILPRLAETMNQLGLVSKGAGRLNDADRWYLKAQDIKSKIMPHDASTLNNLANLYLTQSRLEEAEEYALRAVKIYEQIENSSDTWRPYNALAQIAEKKGSPQKAAEWRQKAHESRDGFAGTKYKITKILQQFKPVIEAVTAGCSGDEEAKQMVVGAFDQMQQDGYLLKAPIQKIWAGDRDADTLTAELDYEDRAIVLAILSVLHDENPFETTDTQKPQQAAPEQEQPQTQPEEQQQMSLADLIKMAALASGPGMPPQVKTQLEQVADQMAAETAPEMQALGQVLKAVLSGDKNPDLTGLPEEMAAEVRGVLG